MKTLVLLFMATACLYGAVKVAGCGFRFLVLAWRGE